MRLVYSLKAVFWKAVFVSAMGATTVPAFAQEVAVNTRFGDWRVACEAVTVSTNVCRLVQELVDLETEAVVLRLLAIPTEDGSAALIAQLPMGVFLPGGAVFRPESNEDAEQTELVWQRCLGIFCEAALILNAEQVAEIESAETILFGYRMGPETDPTITRINMSQFAAGIDALRTGGQ